MHHDKKAVICNFCVGDQVLLFSSIPGTSLEAKYVGPFTILDRVGPVDYIIATPERRKFMRLVHVNMLNAHVSRSDSVCPLLCVNENNCG